jgi:hypothetical protein
VRIYVGYPESKLRWVIEKKQEYSSKSFILPFHVLLFDIASTIVEALVAGHQFLYPCIVE